MFKDNSRILLVSLIGTLFIFMCLACFQSCANQQKLSAPTEAQSRPLYSSTISADSLSGELNQVLSEFRNSSNADYRILEIRQTTLRSGISIYEIDLEHPSDQRRLTLVYDTAFRKYQVVTYRGQATRYSLY